MEKIRQPVGESLDWSAPDLLSALGLPMEDLQMATWRLMSVLRWGNPAEVLAAVPAMLPQLLIPTIIFQGSHDKAVPEQFAQRASSLIPHSKVVMVDSGHFIP